jgi:hypothetical protein
VTCPWHGARFDIKTGAVLGPPAGREVRSYPVRVTGARHRDPSVRRSGLLDQARDDSYGPASEG